MKLHVMSDLHLEFYKDPIRDFIKNLPQTDAEVLVLAGDIVNFNNWKYAIEILTALAEHYKHVLYIPGNHEYYKCDAEDANVIINSLPNQIKNFNVLKAGERVYVEGQSFIGGTLWFKFANDNLAYSQLLNDFYLIHNFIPWVYKENEKLVQYLTTTLLPTDVVITHHMPSPNSIAAQYFGDPINRFFITDLHNLIEERQPKLWIHGHTHISFDYKIVGTRVLCNPKGYPTEKSTTFNSSLVIEV